MFMGPPYALLQPARSVCVASERFFVFIYKFILSFHFASALPSMRRFAAKKLRDHQPTEAETSLHQICSNMCYCSIQQA